MFDSIRAADHARLSRFAALASCVLAAVACLWLLVKLAWLLVPQADPLPPVAPVTAPAVTTPLQSVAKWHLFGNNQSIALLRTRDAPATQLNLTLRGTLAMHDPREGIAMIQDEHGAEHAYKVGEDVAPGTRLSEVYPEHVVLDHGGAAETLRLPTTSASAPAAAAGSHDPPGVGHAPAAAGGATAVRASSVPPDYAPPALGNGVDWIAAQKQLQMDPAQLAKQVRVEPVFVGGRIAGARLSAGGAVGEMMARAGLKSTDLVTAVNGQALSAVSNPAQLMDNLKGAGSVSVTVLRDGKPATLTLDLH